MHVFVKYAPNLTDTEQLYELQKMIGEFSEYEGTVPDSTINVVSEWVGWGTFDTV